MHSSQLKRYIPAVLMTGVVLLIFVYLGITHKSKNTETSKTLGAVTITPLPIPNTPYVSAYGTKLYVNGQQFKFTGANAYGLAGDPGSNVGCGGATANMDTFLAKLLPNSVVRLWAFQGSMATNPKTKKTDWTGLDKVVAAAAKNKIKLILVLGDQSGTCDDGHWRDPNWYSNDFKQVTNEYKNGLTPLPYFEYVKAIVSRYKDSITIAMWEPINEPEAGTCSGAQGSACYGKQKCVNETVARQSLRSFFDTVGDQIKSIDPNHIVSSGLVGDGQCGTVFEDYQFLHQSSGIDIASYHDYNRDDEVMPGDQWNGLGKRLKQMTILNKPLFIGEAGMKAKDNSSQCMNYSTRSNKIKAKMDAQFAAGIVGYLPWDLTEGTSSICNFDIVKDDPLIELLKKYSFPQLN